MRKYSENEVNSKLFSCGAEMKDPGNEVGSGRGRMFGASCYSTRVHTHRTFLKSHSLAAKPTRHFLSSYTSRSSDGYG